MSPVLVAGIGIIALAGVVLALVQPRVALLLLIGADVTNLNEVIADQVGVSPYRLELALALLAALVLAGRGQFRLRWSPVLLGVAVLYAGFAASLIGADAPAVSTALFAERSRDLLFLLVVLVLVLSTSSARQVAMVSVLGLAALAGLTAVHEFVLHNQGDLFGLSRVPLQRQDGAFTARHAGTSSDVNFWARSLILFTPLAMSLWAIAGTRLAPGRWLGGRLERWLWLGCVASLTLGIYLTQSRGGFIALACAVAVWMLLAGRVYRRALLVVGAAAAIAVPLSGIGSRLATLVAGSGTADASVAERRRLQADALRMFLDDPVNGHGIGSYPSIFAQFDRLSDYSNGVDIVVAAHNLYLEQAADGGVLLLVAWGVFGGTVWFCLARARMLARAAGDAETGFLALGILAGLTGWLVASVFLHLSDFRSVLVAAALAAALDLQARGLPIRTGGAGRPSRTPPTRRVQAVVAVVGALSLAGLVAVAAAPGRWQVTTTMPVFPTAPEASGAAAYQLDVISRGLIVPTLVAALDEGLDPEAVTTAAGVSPDGPVTVEVTQSRLGGALLVSVTAPDRQSAAQLAEAAAQLAEQAVTRLDPHYAVSTAGSATRSVPSPLRWLALPLAGLLAWSGATWAYWIRRQRARRTAPAGSGESMMPSSV